MSTFDSLVADLSRDAQRVQPKDALQFCATWFQSRLEEQRARIRETLAAGASLPVGLYLDAPIANGASNELPISPFSQGNARRGSSIRASAPPSPFGTLNVPGNALLSDDHNMGPPTFLVGGEELPPTSPLTIPPQNSFASYGEEPPSSNGDYLQAPSSNIFARRTSVSAESIAVDSTSDEPLPTYPKTSAQLECIKSAISNHFLFRDLDEEQETGVLAAFREQKVPAGEVVIRQGDVGDFFYIVEDGLLHVFKHPEPLPPTWSEGSAPEKFLQPGYHPVFGHKVGECPPGGACGELALMYNHLRSATVLAPVASTLWALDRMTFRTIITKAAHRRRTMYEQFLSSVSLLSSLEAEERSKVADALKSRTYADGEAVVRQGEMGDTFFFVEDGEATVTKTQVGDDGPREITVGHLTKGDYFGELSLLRLAPRAATVSAVHRTDASAPKLKVAALDAPSFTRLLGPLRELMERKAGAQYGA
ncbi:hypothetical protein PLICRDRAFT_693558 [Plicaturopsis crispa FD-325 SS-3]|nr:hypothetical protein PLICRDRAFT_693558 [Plicaturopsis crispa FD-325 SS-3]